MQGDRKACRGGSIQIWLNSGCCTEVTVSLAVQGCELKCKYTFSPSALCHTPLPSQALFQLVSKRFLAFSVFHYCCQCCRDIYCPLVIQEPLRGSQRLRTAPGLTVDKQIICRLGLVEEYLDRNSRNPNQTGSLPAERLVYCSGLWVWKCQAQADFFRLLGFHNVVQKTAMVHRACLEPPFFGCLCSFGTP